MRLREATSADSDAIARLHADSWRATYRGAYSDAYLDGPVFEERQLVWNERLSTPSEDQYVVLAEDGSEMLGFACAYANRDLELGALLDNLHVRPDLHARGIGKQLVIAVAKWCAERHPDAGMYLGVLTQNENAQAFYKRLGGTDLRGEVTTEPGGGTVPYRVYAWSAEEVGSLAHHV